MDGCLSLFPVLKVRTVLFEANNSHTVVKIPSRRRRGHGNRGHGGKSQHGRTGSSPGHARFLNSVCFSFFSLRKWLLKLSPFRIVRSPPWADAQGVRLLALGRLLEDGGYVIACIHFPEPGDGFLHAPDSSHKSTMLGLGCMGVRMGIRTVRETDRLYIGRQVSAGWPGMTYV